MRFFPVRRPADPSVPELRRAARLPLGDAELRDLTLAALAADGYDEDDCPFAIEYVQDVVAFHGDVCNAIPDGYRHVVQDVGVWPIADEFDALVTLDLPGVPRLASLTVDARNFTNPEPGGTAANAAFALDELLYQARSLTAEFETALHAAPGALWPMRRRRRRARPLPARAEHRRLRRWVA
ncbi:hypothetical protein [Actinomadura atramentaria]|uniref:hypothetical protein n=1 Tax=Actinomadura atramentaria TaxID=1990 RepID=UPI000362633F|nr:hypothetical protein [Actinomadura atramentaria]